MTACAIYIDCSADAALLVEQLRGDLAGELVIHHGDPAETDLIDLMKGYERVLNGHTRMTRPVLEGLSPGLKKIVFLGTGAASYIDMAAAEELDIAVVTIANYGDRSVAEHAFALMMAAVRDVAAMDRALRVGEWVQRSGMELEGKTVGVVGQGGIGRTFASMAAAFGMRVVVWNRSAIEVPEGWTQAKNLEDLFSRSNVVSLHLAYNEQTHQLIGDKLMASMPPGAILINTAREGILDLSALRRCLEEGALGHAAIDVFEPEPPAPDHPLLGLPNVTLTAHSAWKTPDASRRLMKEGLAALWAD